MVHAPKNNQESIKRVSKRKGQSKNHSRTHDVPKQEGVMKKSTHFVIFSMCVLKGKGQSKNHSRAHDIPKLDGVMKESTHFVIFSTAYGVVWRFENADRSFFLGVTGKRSVDTFGKIWGE